MPSYLERARQRLELLRPTSARTPGGPDEANEINEITPRRDYENPAGAEVVLRENEKNEISPLNGQSGRRCLVCGAVIMWGLWYFCGGTCAAQWCPESS